MNKLLTYLQSKSASQPVVIFRCYYDANVSHHHLITAVLLNHIIIQ
jgi:hypothetical protein